MDKLRWKGPYQFHTCGKLCPQCRSALVTVTGLDWNFLRRAYHDLGVTCYCVRCNVRYRAFGMASFRQLFAVVSVVTLIGLGLVSLLAFWIFSFWMFRFIILLFLFCCLFVLPRFLFFATERIWWKEASLEKILAYETLDKLP